MDIFNLPPSTILNKNIPKNAFEGLSNKQKKLFTNLIGKMTWTHKLAPNTINLPAKCIEEIQVFHVELKRREYIQELLAVINKYIPYSIVFVIQFDEDVYVSASSKHRNPTLADTSVVDWEFSSDWFSLRENTFKFSLKDTLDFVFFDMCKQLSPFASTNIDSFSILIEKSAKLNQLEKEAQRLSSAISNCKQFNRKVELNLQIKKVEECIRVLRVTT